MANYLSQRIKRQYPSAAFDVAIIIVVFSRVPTFTFPRDKYERTIYVVLESEELDSGGLHWGENWEHTGRGFYLVLGLKKRDIA